MSVQRGVRTPSTFLQHNINFVEMINNRRLTDNHDNHVSDRHLNDFDREVPVYAQRIQTSWHNMEKGASRQKILSTFYVLDQYLL